MTTAVFDTLKVSQNLKAAGFNEAQAGAIVQSMADAFEDTVATKADNRADIAAVRSDIEGLAASTKADNADLKAEVFRALWIQGPGLSASSWPPPDCSLQPSGSWTDRRIQYNPVEQRPWK